MPEVHPAAPLLREPVSLRSRLVRAPGVLYTEVDGSAVVWEPTQRQLHEVSPSAAALWASLDGRSLQDVLLASDGASERDLVEAVRRLKALLLVGDLDDAAPPLDALEEEGEPPDRVELRGEVRPVADGAVLVLVLGGQDPEEDGGTVEIDVDRATVLGPGSDDGRSIVRIDVPAPDEPDVRALSPVELLGVLMAAVAESSGAEPLILDVLAGLAEAVPGHTGPDQDLARSST